MRHKHQASKIATSIKAQAKDRAMVQAKATYKTKQAQQNNISKIYAQRLDQVAATLPNTRKGNAIRVFLGL